DDGPGDAVGEPLVTVGADEAGELGLVGLVDQGGRGDRPGGVHAHVERPLGPVAEAPLGAVELRRADAQVEERAARARPSEARQHLGEDLAQTVEAGAADDDALAEAGEPLAGGRDGVGVLVEAEDRQVRVGVEERLGVAAAAEGGVDDDARGHGREQLDDEVDHHGAVVEAAHSFRSLAAWRRAASGPSSIASMRRSQRWRAQMPSRWRAPTTSTGPERSANSRSVRCTTTRPWASGWTGKVAATKASKASDDTSPRATPSS